MWTALVVFKWNLKKLKKEHFTIFYTNTDYTEDDQIYHFSFI